MSKTIAKVELYSPAIVIFDPAVFDEFLRHNNVVDSNIFRLFLNDKVLGRSAIEQGVLLPMYPIAEDEYSVFMENSSAGSEREPAIFDFNGFPLRIISGLTVISDLSALCDWDPGFFLNYKSNYATKVASNDYLDVTCGLFDVTVRGYTGLEAPLNPLGYGLEFKPTDNLPGVDDKIAVDDRNFTLQS